MKHEKIVKLEKELVQTAVIYNLSLEGNDCYFANNIFNHNTGLYGPLHKKIVPKNKKALAWGKQIGTTKSGKPIYEFVAKSVKGMTPAPFIRPVFHQQFVDIVVNGLNEAFKEVEFPVKR